MTDIINLNSIRSDNCDCNKPKPKEHSCGCHNHKPQPCYLAVDLSDLYFKVKNLFGELKSEWQRAEARSNLGIIDILKLELTKESLESGGTNEWTMTTLKGGVTSVYKFYVKNGLRGETGPLGKSAYDIYCETTTDYPAKTLALWLSSLKGDQGEVGPAGKSAYDIYCEYTTDYPVKTEPQWLASLKGEPGDKGDPGDGEGDKIVSVTLVNPPTTVPEDIYVWRITLKSGQTFDLWAPKEGEGNPNPSTPSGTLAIMYKKLHYDQKPTESTLNALLEDLQIEVNSGNQGKTITLLEALNWRSYAGTVRENDFIFMASTVIVDNNINPWTVVRLTPLDGDNGTSGDGTKGDFKSTAFARTTKNISNAQPAGGDYNRPVPSSLYYAGETIEWKDEIPDIINGEAKVLWSTTRIFKGNGEETAWSLPTRVLDTPTYDVEFSPYSNSDGTAPNTTSNIEASNDWFDPTTDVNLPGGLTWSDMIWRAERHKNSQLESWSNWVITRIKGEKGDPGTGGDGTGKQGLTGPVIRMRGTWIQEAGRGNPGDPECYKNESNELPELDRIRFIDVVFYKGSYWMVNPGVTCALPGTPPDLNSNQWTKATQFDFAYINTLISDYISTNYLDAEEIRIHNRSYDSNDILTGDIIVAGMTSGKNKNNSELNNAGDVRIWAGSNINAGVGLYQLNVLNAPFRVTQNGNLYAEKANIEGTIQANTLRLGELNPSNEGTFVCPEDTNGITLPKLASNKIQMFYILTNYSNITSNITVTAQGTDNILYTNGTTTIKDSTFPAKPNKLYQLFGVSNGTSEVWYVVELDLAAATVIINPEEDANFCGIESIIIITNDEWTKPKDLVEEYILLSLNIKGNVHVFFKNETSAQKTINADDVKVRIKYEALAIELDPGMLMIPSQLANQVSYELTLHLLSSLVSSNGSKVLTYEYIGNNTYNDSSTVAITNISYNGTSTASNATYNGKPDIGVVTVTPSTINKNIKTTEDGDTKITLTNIPVTIL